MSKSEELAKALEQGYCSYEHMVEAAAYIRHQDEAIKLAIEALEDGWSTKYTGKDARALGDAALSKLREVQG
jgi:hypothetical protein